MMQLHFGVLSSPLLGASEHAQTASEHSIEQVAQRMRNPGAADLWLWRLAF